MKIETGNLQTRILLATCGLLALVIVAEQLLPVPALATNAPAMETAKLEIAEIETPAYVHPHIDDFAEVLERPVFFADRRLPPPPENAPAAPQAPIRLKLEGVAIVAESRIAVLRNLADNQLIQLEQGMSHNGWKLETVDAGSASFSRGDRVTTLTLDPAGGNR